MALHTRLWTYDLSNDNLLSVRDERGALTTRMLLTLVVTYVLCQLLSTWGIPREPE